MKTAKGHIHAALLDKTNLDLLEAEKALAATLTLTRDEALKSEGKYDTRGIEAGQLAGAQMRRVEELKLELQMLEELPLRVFQPDEPAALGALVDLEFKGQVRTYFLASTAGGTLIPLGDKAVLVISVFSPIGDALLGVAAGEAFALETPAETREYKVVGVC